MDLLPVCLVWVKDWLVESVISLKEGLFEVVDKHISHSLLVFTIFLFIVEKSAFLVDRWSVLRTSFTQFDYLLCRV